MIIMIFFTTLFCIFNRSGISNRTGDALKVLAGTMMASMSQTLIYLPRVTHHLPTKISTILLNQEQIRAIQYPAKWKVLKAPFGGGKTVVLAEIAKKLLKVFQKSELLNLYFLLYIY